MTPLRTYVEECNSVTVTVTWVNLGETRGGGGENAVELDSSPTV